MFDFSLKSDSTAHKVYVPWIIATIGLGVGLGWLSADQAEFLEKAIPAALAMVAQAGLVFFTANKPKKGKGTIGTPLVWLLPAVLAFPFLSGCAAFGKVDEIIDQGRAEYCSRPTVRATVKTVLDPEARSEDWALCIRCEGEEGLSCIGDPKSLPESELITGS